MHHRKLLWICDADTSDEEHDADETDEDNRIIGAVVVATINLSLINHSRMPARRSKGHFLLDSESKFM